MSSQYDRWHDVIQEWVCKRDDEIKNGLLAMEVVTDSWSSLAMNGRFNVLVLWNVSARGVDRAPTELMPVILLTTTWVSTMVHSQTNIVAGE